MPCNCDERIAGRFAMRRINKKRYERIKWLAKENYPRLSTVLHRYRSILLPRSCTCTHRPCNCFYYIRDSYHPTGNYPSRMPSESANKNDNANNCGNDKSKFPFSVCQRRVTFFMHTFMRHRTSDLEKPHCVEWHFDPWATISLLTRNGYVIK